jgi:integrase
MILGQNALRSMADALTETAIARRAREAKAFGARQDLRDPGHRGLWLRVGKTGTKTWALRARDRAGKPHWFNLGHHPTMGLADARRAANETLVAVRNGANPIAERRAQRAASAKPRESLPPTDTLSAVLAIYEAQRGCDLRSWAHSRKRVDRVFSGLMFRSVQSLTAADFQIAADQFPARQSASFAVRTIRPVLRWATKRGYCAGALVAFDQPAAVRRRSRVLDRGELAALLPVLGDGPTTHGACLRFILLTCCRLSEATGARWQEIDWQASTWTVPRENAKNDREHVVPLSRQALALLRKRMTAEAQPHHYIFASDSSTSLGNWDRVGKWFQEHSGVTGWHRHDLRRSAATMMGELGTDPHVIEAALGHATVHSGLSSIYNRSRYRHEVAAALQLLADTLDGIEQGGAEIVALAVPA